MLHLRNERDGGGGPLPPRGVPGTAHELPLEALYIPSPSPHLIGRLALAPGSTASSVSPNRGSARASAHLPTAAVRVS